MADVKMKTIANGRKFKVVKALIGMWLLNFAAITYMGIEEILVPQSLGVSLGFITAGIVGYIGVNVWQKKVQGSNMTNVSVSKGDV